MFYQKKDLLEKAATKAQADIAKKQYKKLDDTLQFDKIIIKGKPTLETIVNQI